MNIILLSGGSGKRLWPLSNDTHSKQFLRILKNKKTNEYESMVQKTFSGIKSIYPNANITVATSKKQISPLINQIGKLDISEEPYKRNTFPAIILSAFYLTDIKKISKDEVVIISPIDSYVDLKYYESFSLLEQEAKKTNIVLMGIVPTYPSEKYGYIIPNENSKVSSVKFFKEKPSKEIAEQYIKENGLWNAGVFACKLSYLLEQGYKNIPFQFNGYSDLYNKYNEVEDISFDYAIVEKEKDMKVISYDGQWSDLGTWNALTEKLQDNIIGNGIINKDCKNVHLINKLDIPIVAVGITNVVVSSSPDGILVCDKESSDYIKPIVENLNKQNMYQEKSWGSYQVIDVDKKSLTIKVTLFKNNKMFYHNHKNRNEVWVVIEGSGITVVDGMKQDVNVGDIVTIEAGCKHTIYAKETLKLIEVQLGDEISVYDKEKFKESFSFDSNL